jgi:DNA-binding response OmpR family regulator
MRQEGCLRLLVVEDDQRIAAFVAKALRTSGYEVVVRENGEDGYLDARCNPYDLIVLDLMLPDMDGYDITRELRRAGTDVPILMLTARVEEQDLIRGLDIGADDYLTKPFRVGELLARVRALLRRESAVKASTIQVADLAVDTAAHRVFRGDEEITLSAREYALLEFLAYRAGQTVSREVIEQHIWGDTAIRSNVVDVYMGYLRAKIDQSHAPPLLHTVRGMGYALREG